MFLKKLLKKFLFKARCEFCGEKLKESKVFCSLCQADFYYKLSETKKSVCLTEEGYLIDIKNKPYFKILFQRVKNPKNVFLIEGIISLITLLIIAQDLPWPKRVVKTSFFENKRLNHQFFKRLSKFLNLPVVKNNKNQEEVLFFLN